MAQCGQFFQGLAIMLTVLWIVFGVLLLSWSGLLWALHALITLPAGWTDTLRGWLDALPGAEWLEQWWPGWRDLVVLLADLGQHLLGLLGVLASWLTPLMWAVWGLGSLALLAVAGVLHGVIRVSARDVAQARPA